MYSLITAEAVHGRVRPWTNRERIAAVIAAEARGEGVAGMRAVAEVIRNRGGDPVDVVTKRGAFSCLRKIDIDTLTAVMAREEGFKTAYQVSEELWFFQLGDLTKGATHFCRAPWPWPKWAKGQTPTVVIGRHVFFKLCEDGIPQK